MNLSKAGAVGAEVEENDGVGILHLRARVPVRIGEDNGDDELVGDTAGVGVTDGGERVAGGEVGLAVDKRAVGLFDAIPAGVAIHGIVATADGGELADAERAHFLLELSEVVHTGGGRGVAAVEEGVDEDALDAVLLGHLQQGEEVMDVGMDPAIADQPEQMELLGVGALHRAQEQLVAEEFARGDGQVNAGDVHIDDAAGADVEMADFAVAHLPLGQADVGAGGVHEGVGEFFQQFIPGGLAGERDGVGLPLGAVAPAIQDGQHQRFRQICHLL